MSSTKTDCSALEADYQPLRLTKVSETDYLSPGTDYPAPQADFWMLKTTT